MSTAEFVNTAMSETARFVKRARSKLRLTQAELAEVLGLERRSIGRYEKGDELPPMAFFAIKHLLSKRKKKRS